jgi:hypothetical protein
MATIRVIVEDDSGQQTEQAFTLTGDLDTLDGIEQAVEAFRLQVLPQVEQTLLEDAQIRHLNAEKKTLPQG